MKRYGNLMASIADPDNLRLAYWKASKGKRSQAAVRSFSNELDTNLLTIRAQLLQGKVSVGKYHLFHIFDPKKRLICAAAFDERVLHHAVMNVCHPHFEQAQIFDSYASRKGKGTYAALARARHFQAQYGWFLKLDFRQYFASLDHEVLRAQLRRMYKDAHLLRIFDQIIDSYHAQPGKGVPIGNLGSQYFANHYLAAADHYATRILGAPAYVRYMDDIVIWHNDREALLAIGEAFAAFCTKNLQLTLKPFCLNRTQKGLPFLGYLLYPNRVLLAKRSRVRFMRKLRQAYEHEFAGSWSQAQFQRHVLPLISFTRHANSNRFRRRILRNFETG